MPIKNIDWLMVKKGPIFKSNFHLNDLDMSNLTANQRKALTVLQSCTLEQAKNTSVAIAYVHEYFNEVQGFLDLKASINTE